MEDNPQVWITVESDNKTKTYETELSPIVFTDLVLQLMEESILGFSIYRIDKNKKMVLH
jgi:hypothetical protein|tara:strand:+ start:389 stop:565 length:177 start_codon:yes stop_codon:yes gene_type:complete